MEDFNKEGAFFETVNRNNAARRRDEQTAAEVSRNVNAIYINAARAKEATKRETARKRKLEKRKKIKVMAVAGAVVAVLAAGITVNVVHGDEIEQNIVEHNDYNEAVGILKYNIQMVLTARNMAQGVTLNNNSVEQYSEISLNSPEEVYMLRYEMPFRYSDNFEKEFNKIIRSISYYNSDGELCYYNNYDDYLKASGLTEEQFKEAVRNKIITRYRANDIKEILYEGFGTANMTNPGYTKGGR